MPASSLALVVAAASSSSPLHARHDSVRGDEDDSSALPKKSVSWPRAPASCITVNDQSRIRPSKISEKFYLAQCLKKIDFREFAIKKYVPKIKRILISNFA